MGSSGVITAWSIDHSMVTMRGYLRPPHPRHVLHPDSSVVGMKHMPTALRIFTGQRKRLLLLVLLASMAGAWWALGITWADRQQAIRSAILLDVAVLLALGFIAWRSHERRLR